MHIVPILVDLMIFILLLNNSGIGSTVTVVEIVHLFCEFLGYEHEAVSLVAFSRT